VKRNAKSSSGGFHGLDSGDVFCIDGDNSIGNATLSILGSATVNGNADEWDLQQDFFANMYQA
jgi:hypothetical protein